MKNRRNKGHLIAKREALKTELNWNPEVRLMHRNEGAFVGAYSKYRIDGALRMDPDTFFNRIRRHLIDLEELVNLVFNSLMTNVYNLNIFDQIVLKMINNISYQIENPAILNSRFVFEEVLYMDINIHQLNLTRGPIYLPLPDWLASKKAIINPKNAYQECFKWAVIAASR